jgi:hypothetical protein
LRRHGVQRNAEKKRSAGKMKGNVQNKKESGHLSLSVMLE